ncbi:MAG: hypothetical protein V5A68_04600 [Candidatus Thermoplasmatota archaeon]
MEGDKGKEKIVFKPSTPDIDGPCKAKMGETCTYFVSSNDPQGDYIYYKIKFSDDPSAVIKSGPYQSGMNVSFKHCWCGFYQKSNPFCIKIQAEDICGHKSEWKTFETKLTDVDIIDTSLNGADFPLLLLFERIFDFFF